MMAIDTSTRAMELMQKLQNVINLPRQKLLIENTLNKLLLDHVTHNQETTTLRDKFAMAALADPSVGAEQAYLVADAMLQERGKGKEPEEPTSTLTIGLHTIEVKQSDTVADIQKKLKAVGLNSEAGPAGTCVMVDVSDTPIKINVPYGMQEEEPHCDHVYSKREADGRRYCGFCRFPEAHDNETN